MTGLSTEAPDPCFTALTWGQTELFDWAALNGSNIPGLAVIRDITPAPGIVSLSAAETALRLLASRHRVLSAKFKIPRVMPSYLLSESERPTQVIDESAGFEIRLPDSETYESVGMLMRVHTEYQSGRATVDPERDASVGLIFRRKDGRYGCVLVTSHLRTDGQGVRRLAEEYGRLTLDGTSDALLPAVDPTTVVLSEQGSRKAQASSANLKHMEAVLRTTPADMLIRQHADVMSSGTIRSARFTSALDLLSRRYSIPKGGILTSLIALLMWREYGFRLVVIRSLFQLPAPIRGTSYVGPNALPALTAISVVPEWSVARFMSEAWAACVASYRTAAYNPVAFDLMQHELATEFGATLLNGIVYINYHAIPDAFLWNYERSVRTDMVLSHNEYVPESPVFRTLVDVKETSKSAIVQMKGAIWHSTGSALRQCEALVRLAVALAAEPDSDIDLRRLWDE